MLYSSSVSKLKTLAKDKFKEKGIYGVNLEDWKYTDIRRFLVSSFSFDLEKKFSSKIDSETKKYLENFSRLDAFKIIFIDGELFSIDRVEKPNFFLLTVKEVLNSNKGVYRELFESSLKKTSLKENLPFNLLNMSYFEDGFFLYVKENEEIKKPILVLDLTTGSRVKQGYAPRNFIQLGKNSSICLIENIKRKDFEKSLYCGVLEAFLADGADLSHTRVLDYGRSSFSFSSLNIFQSKFSNYNLKSFLFSGKVVRNEMFSFLEGEGANADISSLSAVSEKQHIDSFIELYHKASHTTSSQKIKGIYGGESCGVFSGGIEVLKGANKVSAFQSSSNLLLDKKSKVKARPQLKIFTDDVKCSHGSSIGQLDEEALFYLRSRGIGEVEAKEMLIKAFANEILDLVDVDIINSHISKYFAKLFN